MFFFFFFFKQKTAYEMRISDWSSDVCSSDLAAGHAVPGGLARHSRRDHHGQGLEPERNGVAAGERRGGVPEGRLQPQRVDRRLARHAADAADAILAAGGGMIRRERRCPRAPRRRSRPAFFWSRTTR